MDSVTADGQRLDHWLWSTRFFKTRGLASDAIKNGRVEVNGVRAKPAKIVKVGDLLYLRRPPFKHEIEVRGVTRNRVSARLAQDLYQETPASLAAAEALRRTLELDRVVEERRWGKLSKRERREREHFKRAFE